MLEGNREGGVQPEKFNSQLHDYQRWQQKIFKQKLLQPKFPPSAGWSGKGKKRFY